MTLRVPANGRAMHSPPFPTQVRYYSDNATYWVVSIVFFTISLVASIVVCIVKTVNHNRRNARTIEERNLSASLLGKMLLFLTSGFAQVFFW